MKQYTKEEVEKRYNDLPPELREALFASTTTQKMLSIGRKNGLLMDKVGILAEETGYVMVGLTHPNEFTARLAEALAVAPMKAREIAEDVNEQVFKSIREHLIELHNIKTPEAPKQPPSFVPTAPKPPEKASFVAPMIFPEKVYPPQAPAPAPTPTTSDIPIIKKMPLEPSGEWKPPQPITPIFDEIRRREQPIAPLAARDERKPDPYHETTGPEIAPPPPPPPPPAPIRKPPPAPRFIDTINETQKKEEPKTPPPAQPVILPPQDTTESAAPKIETPRYMPTPPPAPMPPPPPATGGEQIKDVYREPIE